VRALETVFFDMGSTLLDFHQGRSDAEKDAVGLERMASWLRERSGSVDGGGLREGFFLPWSEVFALRRETLTEYPVEDYLAAYLGPLGLELDRGECIELMGEYHRGYGEDLVVAEGAPETLRELRKRGYAIGVISNCALFGEVMVEHFRRGELDPFIDSYTFSYSLGPRKPRPEIFEHALRQLAARPESSLMIGDRLDSDVAGAQRVGMQAAWFNPSGAPSTSAVVPDFTIAHMPELLARLQPLNGLGAPTRGPRVPPSPSDG